MNRLLNYLAGLTTIGFLLEKFMDGNLSVELTTFMLVMIAILMGLDSAFWNLIKMIYTILTFSQIFLKYTNSKQEYISLMGSILTAMIALYGIYFIVSKVFGLKSSSDNDVHFTYNKRTGKIKKDSKWF